MAYERRQRSEEFGKMIGNFQKYFTKSSCPLKQGLPLYLSEGCHLVLIEYQAEGNKTFEYEVDFFILEDEKGILGYLVSYEDTENLKELERKNMQLESLLAEKEIAASYVHELKNPLFSIRGFLQIIRQSLSDGDKRKEYADIAINELDRMNNLLNDYLSRYRTHNTPEIKSKGLSVKKIIEELIVFFEHSLHLKGITYKIEFEDSDLQVLMGKEQLMQVLLNIVQNSIEAMDKGAHLSIRAFKDEDWVCIEIKDEGVGIKQSDLDKIFTPFFSTKENGTGLGLYITKRIVDSNGGSINIKSTEGKGTTTYLKFPRAY